MKRIVTLFIALIVVAIGTPAQAQQPNFNYAYYVKNSEEKRAVYFVNPGGSIAREYTPYVPEPNEGAMDIWVSTDGRWSASFISYLPKTSPNWPYLFTVRVFDYLQQVNINAVPDEITPADARIIEPKQNAAWSPDNQYFAFNGFVPNDPFKHNVYVYSTESKTLRTIEVEGDEPYRLIWSPDSSTLAISRVASCANDKDGARICKSIVDFVDSKTLSIKTSVDLSAYVRINLYHNAVCNLSWSPSGAHLAFSTDCDGTVFEVPKEVYVYDTRNGQVKQITDFSTPLLKRPDAILAITYRLAWYNNDILLVGVSGSIVSTNSNKTAMDTEPFGQGLAYDMAKSKMYVIYDKQIVEWAVNPVSRRIVARHAPFSEIGGTLLTTTDLQSVMTSDQRLTLVTDFADTSSFCRLSWNPDGTILAYWQLANPGCVGQSQSITFLKEDLSVSSVHDLSKSFGEAINYAQVIGWVRTN